VRSGRPQRKVRTIPNPGGNSPDAQARPSK
jgi:hypothetical protein